jgi:putative transposase
LTIIMAWLTHLSLEKDSPGERSVLPPALRKVVQFPEVGGVHGHYERLAACLSVR